MRTRILGILAVTVLLLGVPLVAHHGAASFDTENEITLKGTVTEWLWQNPHCFLKFDATDAKGTRNWVVEVSNPPDMASKGWARTSFKVGDQVEVRLQPVKSGAPVGRIRSVVLGNGTKLENMVTLPPAPKPAP